MDGESPRSSIVESTHENARTSRFRLRMTRFGGEETPFLLV
jgi:hypothetical protein